MKQWRVEFRVKYKDTTPGMRILPQSQNIIATSREKLTKAEIKESEREFAEGLEKRSNFKDVSVRFVKQWQEDALTDQ